MCYTVRQILRSAQRCIQQNRPNLKSQHFTFSLTSYCYSLPVRWLTFGTGTSFHCYGSRNFLSSIFKLSVYSNSSVQHTGIPKSRTSAALADITAFHTAEMANVIKLEAYPCANSGERHLGDPDDLAKCMTAAGDCRACGHVKAAVDCLRVGGVVAVPTDTVYGICCLAQSDDAVERIYAIKGRDVDKPLAICVHDVSDVRRWAVQTVSDALLYALLPGPVTVVLERTPALNPRLNPGTRLVGVRVPDSGFVRDVCRACAEPLALTSANVSGAPSSVCVKDFESLWPRLDVVFDAGRIGTSTAGSTVVDLSVPGVYSVIRPGSALDPTRTTLHMHGLHELLHH